MVGGAAVRLVVAMVVVVGGGKGGRREEHEEGEEHELLHGDLSMAQVGIDGTGKCSSESRKELQLQITVVTSAAGGFQASRSSDERRG